ncbi:MAG TPA: FAD:protein FMN transferase [Candidatus Angelobacter sp.]|nr:FAD:protein FMN transferase [Candidatus Angelobacter sp.]
MSYALLSMARLINSSLLLRFYRAGVLLVMVAVVRQQSRWLEGQHASSISIRQARKFFPAANRVQLRDPDRGLYFVTDARNDTIGCLLTTSPQTDNIIGYSGPNNLLIALDSRGAIAGVELLRSGDTKEHVEKVKSDPNFLRSFIGWKPGSSSLPKIEGVSGATLTSFAIAESVQQRLAGAAPSLRFPDPVALSEVRNLFTNAARLVPDQSRLRALDAMGRLLGFAIRTSPQADNVSGYRGPTECLVALAPDGRTVVGLRLSKSYDTDAYVDQIRRAEPFLKTFIGRSVEELASLGAPAKDNVEGIAGATQTARAVVEGVRSHFESVIEAQSQAVRWRPKPRDWALAGVVLCALLMSFTSLRGHRSIRMAWQLVLVAYVGLLNHDLLSLALFGGWATSGMAIKAAPALALLAVAALVVPWTSRRQLYCHQICPHGAAQQLLGKVFRQRWALPSNLAHVLESVPAILLGIGLVTLVFGCQLNLASIEPFDAWVWRTAGAATLVIAIVGLAASLFIPQAYCRFGCPTGALLNFVRAAGSADRWGRRDWTALGFLAAGFAAVGIVRAWPRAEQPPEPLTLTGRTMGTTWSVKIRDEVADPAIVNKVIVDEFEWAENMTSHWRTNTDISEFNRTATTNAMPVPWPVLTLSRWAADISRHTGGAYDITVGPLVNLWGFGPAHRHTEPPTDAEINAALPAVGWQKLEILDGMLRKRHPALEIDLSSIAVGWAIDQVAQNLERRGYTNFLVEAGGELRARGRWTIAVEHPTRICTLTNESIGTSGTYRRNFKSGSREYSHLIDPHTGRPITHHTVTVSARADDCAHADAWGAALNVLGVETGLPLAERLNLAARFVTERTDGTLEIRESSAWKKRELLAGPPPAARR